VEFYEDFYEKHPSESRQVLLDANGEYTFDESQLDGDPLIGKWEKEIAQGITPDLEEGLPQKERDRLAAKRAAKEHINAGSTADPLHDKYRSKRVPVGSAEDEQLRNQAIREQLSHANPGQPVDMLKDLLGHG